MCCVSDYLQSRILDIYNEDGSETTNKELCIESCMLKITKRAVKDNLVKKSEKVFDIIERITITKINFDGTNASFK